MTGWVSEVLKRTHVFWCKLYNMYFSVSKKPVTSARSAQDSAAGPSPKVVPDVAADGLITCTRNTQ